MNPTSPALIAEINERNAAEARESFFARYGFEIVVGGFILALIGVYLAIAPAYHWFPFSGAS